jgi:regulator of cell morphogenesis and NO signaling
MAQLDLDRPVGELVAERPEFSRLFEEFQIDYCCNGDARLEDACQQRALDPQRVLQIMGNSEGSAPGTRNWAVATLSELCDHIEQTHHAYLRKELPRLDGLIAKVVEAHGGHHRELRDVQSVFLELQGELMPHMMKEEQILFPAIRMLEQASQPVNLPFGTVQNPIRMMEHEHDAVGQLLTQIRTLTNDYRIPNDACNTYCVMLQGLSELELDLHQHIHKENNILFPRAKDREAALD